MSWKNIQKQKADLRARPEQPASCSAVALIVVDSGFSGASLLAVHNLLGYWDLNTDFKVVGPGLQSQEGRSAELAEIIAFADSHGGDRLDHGSVVLGRLLAAEPELPVVLVRAFDAAGTLIKTGFEGGNVSKPGWTEGYLWAQALCREQGYLSVANCSFGGFHHAMDGTGWESFQLGRVSGAAKPGHLIVAAAGPGDGRALHASFVMPGDGFAVNDEIEIVRAHQGGSATYNLWVDRLIEAEGAQLSGRDFDLVVTLNARPVRHCRGLDLPTNPWNGRQQLTFTVEGRGAVEVIVQAQAGTRFDIFISASTDGADEEAASFCDHLDAELVSEPAVFEAVIAVGLSDGQYGQCLIGGHHKPDILLPGPGPVSFRTPEVSLALARYLARHPDLDALAARRLCQEGN